MKCGLLNAIRGKLKERGDCTLNTLDLARRIVELSDDRKAKEPVILDLRAVTLVADYFVILSGTSRTQVLGIANHIEEELSKEGILPYQREGDQDARWMLLDYSSVVIHVFQEDTRTFYNLERLWNDAKQVPIDAAGSLQ